MIDNRIGISINAEPESVYTLIETMPNKFPVYTLLETELFLFLRVLLFDGYKSAIEAVRFERPVKELILNIEDTMGPFTLIEKSVPYKYWFRLESLCFNCKTGYTLKKSSHQTILNLDLIAEHPTAKEKMRWFFAKPFHLMFTKKVLKNIKDEIERN